MLKTCVLLELDWVDPMMQFFFARHNLMHISCIHTSYFLSFGTLYNGAFLSPSLSLSLSQIDYIWHPSANPLRLGTPFIPGHLFLTPFLFTFSSVMRRPVKISRRTSPNMVFIRNVAWFYRIFLILLLHPLSFIIGDGNLYLRYPWVVPPWSYRSSTPICTILIPLYLSLLHIFEVHVS